MNTFSANLRKRIPLKSKAIMLAVFASSALLNSMSAQALQVTVTIPPLAGMIAPLLDENDKIEVLLKPGVSPHGFQIKPSQLGILQSSDLLITAGTPVDAWVDKFANRIGAKQIHLAELQATERLPLRKGGVWEKKLPKMLQQSEERHDHSHGHDEHSTALSFDGHIWMSMHNAQVLVEEVTQVLSQLKPQKSQQIDMAKQQWLARLREQDQSNQQRLAPLKDKAYLVLHDAFQYFEHHYGLNGVGSVRLNPEVPPSLKRITELRSNLVSKKVQCVFQEPQFPGKQLQRLTSGTSAKIGTLDPMGTMYIMQAGGKSATFMNYDRFTEKLTDAFVDCLGHNYDR